MDNCCRCDGKGYTLVKHHQPTKRRLRQPCGRCQRTGQEPTLAPLYSEERVLKQLGRWKVQLELKFAS